MSSSKESGSVVEQTSYTPFGEIITVGRESRFNYEAKEHDDEEYSIPTDGLVSYWAFEGSALDEAGHNSGRVHDAVPVKGKVREALGFDGCDDWVLVVDDDSLDTSGDYSLSMWVNRGDSTGTYPTLINRDEQGYDGFWWIFTGHDTSYHRLRFQYGNGTAIKEIYWNSVFELNEWKHLVILYDSNEETITLYVNNESRGHWDTPNAQDVLTGHLYFGKYSSRGTYDFDGMMDEVGLWDRKLTTDEITQLYQYGTQSHKNREEIDFHFRKYNGIPYKFNQPDTVVPDVYDPQTLNRYAFERNSPYNHMDPDGHAIQAAAAIPVIAWAIRALGLGLYAHDLATTFHKAYTGEITQRDYVYIGVSTAVTSVGMGIGKTASTALSATAGIAKVEDWTTDQIMKFLEDNEKKDTSTEIDKAKIKPSDSYVNNQNTLKDTSQDANQQKKGGGFLIFTDDFWDMLFGDSTLSISSGSEQE
jgi:hypothetical protein